MINQILTMMPLALLWLAFDLFIIISFIKSGNISEMLFFIIPFLALHLMPVWIWLGSIISANKKWQNTKYYVTDKRIIIQNGFIDVENVQEIYSKLQKIVLDIQTDIEYPNALRPSENPGYNAKYNGKM